MTTAPPSLPRVQAEPVPLLQRYYEVLRFPDVLPVALRFLRTTVTTPRVCLRSCQVRRRPGAGRFRVWHLPTRPVNQRDGNARASQVPGEPCCAYALFSDPGGTDTSGHTT